MISSFLKILHTSHVTVILQHLIEAICKHRHLWKYNKRQIKQGRNKQIVISIIDICFSALKYRNVKSLQSPHSSWFFIIAPTILKLKLIPPDHPFLILIINYIKNSCVCSVTSMSSTILLASINTIAILLICPLSWF